MSFFIHNYSLFFFLSLYGFLHRDHRLATLLVDGTVEASTLSPEGSTELNTRQTLFIGGVSSSCGEHKLTYRSLLSGRFTSGLQGCLRNVNINGVAIDFATSPIAGAQLLQCS